jgi:eukaryotic-like serine/threonine-protein kinase
MPSASGFEDTEGPPPTAELIDNRYTLIEKIGSGGMATVFLAEDERLGRRVAIKRLGTGGPEDASMRLIREAKLGAALNHPNIVSVYDALPDPQSGTVLIVMELVDGPDLGRDLLDGAPDERRALEILADMAAGLDHAHEHGIVHRDVKPSNVLLARSGRAKLTDLGIAKALEDTGITRSGVILGSVPYMSPEQLSGLPAGPESDVYSLALIAYELLSGERAHTGDNPLRVTHEALHEPPPDLREVRPEVPVPAARVIARALDPEPARRPVSACAFIRELERGLAAKRTATETQATATAPMPLSPEERAEPVEPEPVNPSPADRVRSETFDPPAAAPAGLAARRRFPWPVALTGLAVAAVLAAILLVGAGSGRDPARDRTPAERAQGDGESTQQTGGGADPATRISTAGSGDEPAAAVETFYTQAANGDYDAAFAAATPNLEAQLGGTAQFETLESIEFEKLKAKPGSAGTAAVTFETVATHTDRVEECKGTASVVLEGDKWLLDSIDAVECTPA